MAEHAIQRFLSRLGIAFEDIGQHRLKNIHHAVHIDRVVLDNDATKVTFSLPLPTSLEVPSHGSERSAGIQFKAITALIADLEGFIGLPERLGADTVPLMAGYFELISRQVHAHGGMIAKCVGDRSSCILEYAPPRGAGDFYYQAGATTRS